MNTLDERTGHPGWCDAHSVASDGSGDWHASEPVTAWPFELELTSGSSSGATEVVMEPAASGVNTGSLALDDAERLAMDVARLGGEGASMSTTSRTLSELERLVYQCPSWCRRWDHDLDEGGPKDGRAHYGPDFGAIGMTGFDGEQPTAWVEESRDLTAEDLRKLAADALAAADWLARLEAAEHEQGAS